MLESFFSQNWSFVLLWESPFLSLFLISLLPLCLFCINLLVIFLPICPSFSLYLFLSLQFRTRLCYRSPFFICLFSHSPCSFCFLLLYYSSHYRSPSLHAPLHFFLFCTCNTSFSDLTQYSWVEGVEILSVLSSLTMYLFLSLPPCLLSWKRALVTRK